MSTLAQRLLAAALGAALFATAPVRAAVEKKVQIATLEPCALVCTPESACDTSCAGDDGGESTCGDRKVCACEPLWTTPETIGRHCQNLTGTWLVVDHVRVTTEYGGCRDPEHDCHAEIAGGTEYDSEEACCAAEGCWGGWC